jgi:hypothetical protein
MEDVLIYSLLMVKLLCNNWFLITIKRNSTEESFFYNLTKVNHLLIQDQVILN